MRLTFAGARDDPSGITMKWGTGPEQRMACRSAFQRLDHMSILKAIAQE